MQQTVAMDARGRITIPREQRRFLTKRVLPIATPEGVLLRPVADALPEDNNLLDSTQFDGDAAAAAELES